MTGWEWCSIATLAIGDVLLLQAFLRWDNRHLAQLVPRIAAQETRP